MPRQKKPNNPRKSTGKRLRFEVFARDGFKCRYCGRESSQVELVIDHLHPVSQGGSSEPENLITSCFDCNAGKAAKTLEQHLPGDYDRLSREQELREQERALAAAKRAVQVREETLQTVVNFICHTFHVSEVNRRTATTMTAYYRMHGEILFEWIEMAHRRTIPIHEFGRYVSGIRRSWLEEQKCMPAAE